MTVVAIHGRGGHSIEGPVRLEGIVGAKPNVRLKNRFWDRFFLKSGACATNWSLASRLRPLVSKPEQEEFYLNSL
jgi:hypothetical protein